jgi:hypothetical protein
MKKLLLSFGTLTFLALHCYSQPIYIYPPNVNATELGIVAADSLNYYVFNLPDLTVMKIDGNNNVTLVTTLTAIPVRTMIWNNGRGIYSFDGVLPYRLFDGTTETEITGGQLPLFGAATDQQIFKDYFHKGNTTYFRTSNKIYKTDYTSAASIQTLATVQNSIGTPEMQHTTNSIIFIDPQDPFHNRGASIKRIDLISGSVLKIDSTAYPGGNYEYGTVFNNEYYYCTPGNWGSPIGVSSIYKISDSGIRTLLYTETASNKYIIRIIGVTPNGVIALIATPGAYGEYFSISGGVATLLNFNTNADPLPFGDNSYSTSSITTNSLVYFQAFDTLSSLSFNRALWVTNGTLSGTKKVIGGPSNSFSADFLSTGLPGLSSYCGDDLYFAGANGSNGLRLIHVDGNTYSVHTYPIAIQSYENSLRKTDSGLYLSARDESTFYKAIYKVNCSALSGFEENVSKQILFDFYPNPSNRRITINVNDRIVNCKLTIHNLLGELLLSSTLIEQSTNFNLDFNAGLYFITLDNHGSKSTKKLIIE